MPAETPATFSFIAVRSVTVPLTVIVAFGVVVFGAGDAMVSAGGAASVPTMLRMICELGELLTKSGAIVFADSTFTLFVMTATSCLISLLETTDVPLSDTLALEARWP